MLLLGGMGLLGVVLIFMLFAHHRPLYWSLGIQEVPLIHAEHAIVKHYEYGHREMELPLRVYEQEVSYEGSMLRPHAVPVSLFTLFQCLGWALFLLAATYVKSRWVFLYYFIFSLYIHFSGISHVLLPGKNHWLAEGSILLVMLGMAYMMQIRFLRLKVWGRLLLIALGLGLCYGLVAYLHGWKGLYELSVTPFPFLGIFCLPVLFFIAKDPVNLILAWGSNYREKEKRKSPALVIALLLLYLGLCLFLLLREMKVVSEMLTWLQPLHVMAIAALATLFTSQNVLHHFRNMVSTQLAFCLFLLALPIIIFSHMGLVFSQADQVYIDWVNSLSASLLFFVGLGYVMFFLINHLQLLQQKVNFYFLLTQGTRIPFLTVALVGIGGVAMIQGLENYRDYSRFLHSIQLQKADLAVQKYQGAEAKKRYDIASRIIINGVKAHYNLAELQVAGWQHIPDKHILNATLEHYRIANRDFPYAAVNASSLLSGIGQYEQALGILRDEYSPKPNAWLASNLGRLYALTGKTDSAVICYREALRQRPDLSSTYSNLGRHYLKHAMREEGVKFLRAAVELPQPGEAALCNAWAYQLREEEDWRLPVPRGGDYYVKLNFLIAQMKKDKLADHAPMVRTLADLEQSPEAAILDGLYRFEQDSIEAAISCIQYAATVFPEAKADAWMALGAAYHQRGIPEVARQYYEKAGNGRGRLYAAYAMLDQNHLFLAQLALSRLRVEEEQSWEACSKELAMILLAAGEPVYAETEYPTAQLAYKEWLRVGRYADSMRNYVPALEAFRRAIQMDSTQIWPYLEMGRIYNRYGDSLAIENLSYGLEQASGSDEAVFCAELAKAWLYRGEFDKARQSLERAGLDQEAHPASAAYYLARGDSARALAMWETICKDDPMDAASTVSLAQLYLAKNKSQEAYTLTSLALQFNRANPDLWTAYAQCAEAWGQQDEVAYAREQAASLRQGMIGN